MEESKKVEKSRISGSSFPGYFPKTLNKKPVRKPRMQRK